jgi:hypothetical protein
VFAPRAPYTGRNGWLFGTFGRADKPERPTANLIYINAPLVVTDM